MLICHECEEELKKEYYEKLQKENRNKYNHQHHHSKIRRKLLDDELNNSRKSNDTNYSESNKYRPYEKRLRLPYELDESQKREELK